MAQPGFHEGGPHRAPAEGPLKRKIKALNQFVDCSGPELDHVEFRIWMILFRHATNGIVTRSHGLLANEMAVSTKTVQRAIGRLVEKKLVKIERRGGLHVGASTYRLGNRSRRLLKMEPNAPQTVSAEVTPSDISVQPWQT